MKATTKEKILTYLVYRGWTSGTELESNARDWGTKASVISRRARELAHEGRIERGMSDRKTVQYRSIRPQMTADMANAYLEKLRQEEQVQLI